MHQRRRGWKRYCLSILRIIYKLVFILNIIDSFMLIKSSIYAMLASYQRILINIMRILVSKS